MTEGLGGRPRAFGRETLRWCGAAAVAAVVTLALVLFGTHSYGAFKRYREARRTLPVEILSSSDRMDLARLLGEETGRSRPDLPRLEDIPPVTLPERRARGFVQLELKLDVQGKVTEVEVIEANAPDALVEQTRESVLEQRFEPAVMDGRPVPSVRHEIIELRWPSEGKP